MAISTVLGSCVSVCIFDRKRKRGGMNHFRFPVTRDREQATAFYGNAATLALVAMMLDSGSKTKDLVAQIVGGAHNLEISSEDIGRENVRIARKVLVGKKIRVISEDIGGTQGRKVVYNTANNELAVLKVDTIRKGDWGPYIGDR
ncbi:MAG: chemotaxis protein CheD [Desulfobacterales bacterium]|nr:chemotaxis protein CheD [Desulfobacterales bacterium]